MEVADIQRTSSKTMQEFHANFTSQANSLNTVFHYLTRLITGQTLENNSSSSNSHAKLSQKSQTRAQVALFLSATSTKQPTSRNLTALYRVFFERERPTSNQLHVSD